MSYIKIGQICDLNTRGLLYLEDNNKNIINNSNLQYPLELIVEVIDWESLEEEQKNGRATLHVEQVIINNSASIREEVLQQLINKYPTLVP